MWFFRTNTAVAPKTTAPKTFRAGRRVFITEAPYALPKDWKEDQRLDLQHFMLRKYMRRNFIAPIKNPHTILDAGCGTGRWGSEMAKMFPKASVYASDIHPPAEDSLAIVGAEGVKPENLTVFEGDISQGVINHWNNLFDFTHMRAMVIALPDAVWDTAVNGLVAMTAPGGWVELVDTNFEVDVKNTAIGAQFIDLAKTLFASRGFDYQAGNHLAGRLSKAGLRNIHFYRIQIPMGYAFGEDGGLMAANTEEAMRAIKPLCLKAGLISEDAYDEMLERNHQDLLTSKGRFHPYFVAYGQKI